MLTSRRKGIADDILAQKEKERQRGLSRKRSRSVSVYSSDSVSTISTNRSTSQSPSSMTHERNGKSSKRGGRGGDKLGKRARSPSMNSNSSRGSPDRATRRRMSSFSPPQRGRRARSRSSRMDISRDRDSKREDDRWHRSHSKSSARGRRARRRSRSRNGHDKRPTRSPMYRSRSRSSTRMDTTDDHKPPRKQPRYPPDSRSPSRIGRRAFGPLSRNERSPVPYSREQLPRRSPSPFRARHENGNQQHDQGTKSGPAVPPPQRERSLSPYSKRLALTQSMQGR